MRRRYKPLQCYQNFSRCDPFRPPSQPLMSFLSISCLCALPAMTVRREQGPPSPGGRHIGYTLRSVSPGGEHERVASYMHMLTPPDESASQRKRRREQKRGQERRATTRLDFAAHAQYCESERNRKQLKAQPRSREPSAPASSPASVQVCPARCSGTSALVGHGGVCGGMAEGLRVVT